MKEVYCEYYPKIAINNKDIQLQGTYTWNDAILRLTPCIHGN